MRDGENQNVLDLVISQMGILGDNEQYRKVIKLFIYIFIY